MKKFQFFLKSDSVVRYSFFIGICIVGLGFLLVFINFKRLPPALPLFYSRPWGDPQLGSPIELFILPSGMFFVFVLNTFVSLLIYEKDLLLARVVSIGHNIASLLAFIALLKIVDLVG
jgi:hypothetical protein